MPSVLILGATSAIAAEVARVHAAAGDRLFLVARDAGKLDALASELAPHVLGSASVDFTDTVASGVVLADATRSLAAAGGLDVAVLAHGWLGDQRQSERSVAHAEAIIATNFTSAVALLIPLVNHLESAGRGAIVVLSSVAGDRGRPRNYTYGAAKGALSLYLQGVRSRLVRSAPRVRIVTVRLGPVDTPMTVGHPKNALFAEPPAVARAIVRSEATGPLDVYLPWYWLPIMATVRSLPERVFQRFEFLAGR